MNKLVYGFHPVKSILDTHPKKVLKIHIIHKPLDFRCKLLIEQIHKCNILLENHPRVWFDHMVKGVLHQGIIAEVMTMSSLTENDLLNFLTICNTIPLLLILDGITDPHNLGACLRSAEAAGVHMVIIPRNRAAQINATVRKVSSGAADRVPILRVTNLSRILRLLRKYNIWIVGAVEQSGYTVFNSKLIGPLALVMGSEGRGMRRLTKEYCNELVNIPMKGSIESLNVSVATGICLFEVLRQRQHII